MQCLFSARPRSVPVGAVCVVFVVYRSSRVVWCTGITLSQQVLPWPTGILCKNLRSQQCSCTETGCLPRVRTRSQRLRKDRILYSWGGGVFPHVSPAARGLIPPCCIFRALREFFELPVSLWRVRTRSRRLRKDRILYNWGGGVFPHVSPAARGLIPPCCIFRAIREFFELPVSLYCVVVFVVRPRCCCCRCCCCGARLPLERARRGRYVDPAFIQVAFRFLLGCFQVAFKLLSSCLWFLVPCYFKLIPISG